MAEWRKRKVPPIESTWETGQRLRRDRERIRNEAERLALNEFRVERRVKEREAEERRKSEIGIRRRDKTLQATQPLREEATMLYKQIRDIASGLQPRSLLYGNFEQLILGPSLSLIGIGRLLTPVVENERKYYKAISSTYIDYQPNSSELLDPLFSAQRIRIRCRKDGSELREGLIRAAGGGFKRISIHIYEPWGGEGGKLFGIRSENRWHLPKVPSRMPLRKAWDYDSKTKTVTVNEYEGDLVISKIKWNFNQEQNSLTRRYFDGTDEPVKGPGFNSLQYSTDGYGMKWQFGTDSEVRRVVLLDMDGQPVCSSCNLIGFEWIYDSIGLKEARRL